MNKLDWRPVHDKAHQHYTGTRSPRTDCPYCKKIYEAAKSGKKEDRPNPPEPAKEVNLPKPPPPPVVKEVKETSTSKETSFDSYELANDIWKGFRKINFNGHRFTDDSIKRTAYHCIENAGIPSGFVSMLVEKRLPVLEKLVGALKKVYIGMSERALLEFVIVILSYAEYLLGKETKQEPVEPKDSGRKKQKK